MHREPLTECGGVIKGEAPPNRDGVREVSQHKGEPITTPPQHAKPPKTKWQIHAMCENMLIMNHVYHIKYRQGG